METVRATIDGKELSVPRGARLLDVILHEGIFVPHLCYVEELSPYAGCRTCVVEVEGMRGQPTACTTTVTDGMVVRTKSPSLDAMRRTVLEFIQCDHPGRCFDCFRAEHCGPGDICMRDSVITERCLTCAKNKHCELQDTTEYLDLRGQQRFYGERQSWYGLYLGEKEHTRSRRDNPFIEFEFDKCILCTRCVRVCEEVRGRAIYTISYRGPEAKIETAFGLPLHETNCEFCGACVDVCPTAAIMDKSTKWVGIPDRTVNTICPYCSVGCGLSLQIRRGKVVGAVPDFNNPTNRGQICFKGRYALDFIHDARRLTTPLLRRNGALEAVSWEEALGYVAQRLPSFQGEVFAAFVSTRLTNEEAYLAQKFTRVAMRSNNVDYGAPQRFIAHSDGLATAIGSDAMTLPLSQVGDARTILVLGTNLTETHPVLGLEVIRAFRQGAQVIVAHSKEIELVQLASTQWLRYRPGTELTLVGAMLRVIVEEGLADEAFVQKRCEGFEAFALSLREQFDLDRCAQITGLPAPEIAEVARALATQRPTIVITSLSLGSDGTGASLAQAVTALQMVTGNFGKPSAGVVPLRGTCNEQGTADMGCLPGLLPGYQSLTEADARTRVEGIWGISPPQTPGIGAATLLSAIEEGKVKALYLLGEEALAPFADQAKLQEALSKLELLVVQDTTLGEIGQVAHVVLPGTTSAEKEGTFTNNERRVQRVRQAIAPIGQARPDWQILCSLAGAMGISGFAYDGPEAVMGEIAQMSPIYRGITYARLESAGLQWPCFGPEHPGTPILHEGQFLSGKARLVPLAYDAEAVGPNEEFPLILAEGRRLVHFQKASRLLTAGPLLELPTEGLLELCPQDASRLGLAAGDRVRVRSRWGETTGRISIVEDAAPGVVSLSFGPAGTVSRLAFPTGVGVCAVRLERLEHR